jgi:hypothetical protein
LELMVVDVATNKAVRIEVDQNHTVGSVMETVVGGLGLPKDRAYSLVSGNKELGPDSYPTTLQTAGIRNGDRLDLISRPIGGRHLAACQSFLRRS